MYLMSSGRAGRPLYSPGSAEVRNLEMFPGWRVKEGEGGEFDLSMIISRKGPKGAV